jgi:hypothetical protein
MSDCFMFVILIVVVSHSCASRVAYQDLHQQVTTYCGTGR